MSEIETEARRRPVARLYLDRLIQVRWTLGAAILVVVVLNAWLKGPWFTGVAAAVALILVAAVAPCRSSAGHGVEDAAATEGEPLQAMSAASLASAVPDPLLIFDGGGGLIHANAAAHAAFGQFAPGASVLLKFRTPEMQDLIRGVLSSGGASEADYSERVPVERIYRVHATPAMREPPRYVMVFKDQSEARRIDRMRADFIANASHELRTPLASVSGFIETLRGPARNDPKARESFLQIMQNQTARMARLIDDLLSLSRLETKPFLKPGSRIDIRAVVGSVADSLGHLARESGIDIERVEPAAPVMVAGDRDELIQVFENLLENAIKYGKGGGRVIVTIESADAAGEVSVAVRDFGRGIAEEHIPRITERFYRAGVEAGQKGTGLGLSIVKHILTRHNARLAIRSTVGEGATFTVTLPGA